MYGDWPRKAVLVCRSRQALALTCGSQSRLEPCHFMLSQSHSEELDLRRRFCLSVRRSLRFVSATESVQPHMRRFTMLTCLRVCSIRGRGNGTHWQQWMTWTPRGRTRLSSWGAVWCSGATAAATGVPLRTCARTGAPAVVKRMHPGTSCQFCLFLTSSHPVVYTASDLVGQCAGSAYVQALYVRT